MASDAFWTQSATSRSVGCSTDYPVSSRKHHKGNNEAEDMDLERCPSLTMYGLHWVLSQPNGKKKNKIKEV